VDVTTASPAQLEALPGMRPEMAQVLINARPFRTVDDIKKVKGIGDATFEKLSDFFCVP
jgi:competence protein ComEA